MAIEFANCSSTPLGNLKTHLSNQKVMGNILYTSSQYDAGLDSRPVYGDARLAKKSCLRPSPSHTVHVRILSW